MTEWLKTEEKSLEKQRKSTGEGNIKIWVLIGIILSIAALHGSLFGNEEKYNSTMNKLQDLHDYQELVIKANYILKGAYTHPTFDYRDTVDAFDTANKMRKEAIIHYEKSLKYLAEMPSFDLKEILEASIKESAKTSSSNPRERIIKYVTAMAIEIMSQYGLDAISSLTRFSYEVIHATTLMESAEELTKIAPSLVKFYSKDDQAFIINATMSLVNLDLYTYTFISPKDGMAVSNYFRSVREEFFEHLQKNKKLISCLCFDMLYKVKNFNLLCLCLENTPKEFTAEILNLGMEASGDLFYLEQSTGLKHYNYFDGHKERVEDFWEIQWRAYP